MSATSNIKISSAGKIASSAGSGFWRMLIKIARICSLLSLSTRITIAYVSSILTSEASAMISIIDDLSQVTTGRFECVISGNGIEELMDSATANMALRKAAELGLNRPGVSNAVVYTLLTPKADLTTQ